jgi:hypothetical protein
MSGEWHHEIPHETCEAAGTGAASVHGTKLDGLGRLNWNGGMLAPRRESRFVRAQGKRIGLDLRKILDPFVGSIQQYFKEIAERGFHTIYTGGRFTRLATFPLKIPHPSGLFP